MHRRFKFRASIQLFFLVFMVEYTPFNLVKSSHITTLPCDISFVLSRLASVTLYSTCSIFRLQDTGNSHWKYTSWKDQGDYLEEYFVWGTSDGLKFSKQSKCQLSLLWSSLIPVKHNKQIKQVGVHTYVKYKNVLTAV